jgi:hypothetical protein
MAGSWLVQELRPWAIQETLTTRLRPSAEELRAQAQLRIMSGDDDDSSSDDSDSDDDSGE